MNIASKASGVIFSKACADIIIQNLRSTYLLSVANDLKVIVSCSWRDVSLDKSHAFTHFAFFKILIALAQQFIREFHYTYVPKVNLRNCKQKSEYMDHHPISSN